MAKKTYFVQQVDSPNSASVVAESEQDAAQVFAKHLWIGYKGEHSQVIVDKQKRFYIDWSFLQEVESMTPEESRKQKWDADSSPEAYDWREAQKELHDALRDFNRFPTHTRQSLYQKAAENEEAKWWALINAFGLNAAFYVQETFEKEQLGQRGAGDV